MRNRPLWISMRRVSMLLAGLAVPVGGEGPGLQSSGQGRALGVRDARCVPGESTSL